jgi:hypothetical protein
MQNIFGIYKNWKDGAFRRFVIRELPPEKEKQLENTQDSERLLQKKTEDPGWMTLTCYPALALGILFILWLFIDKDGFVSAYQSRGYLLYIGIVLVLYALFCIVYLKRKKKNVKEDPSVRRSLDESAEFIKECFRELAVPESAVKMDVLFPLVKKNKKGEEKIRQATLVTYVNQELRVFKEGDALCFADTSQVVSLPISAFKRISKINKSILLPCWNKERAFTDEEYREYKLRANGMGFLISKPFYSLELEIDGTQYEIFLPSYERNAFLALVPLEETGETAQR